MKKAYKFYSDPGHGWLAVPIAELKALGIAELISSYSYQRGGTAYLEEDCDAGRFMNAVKLVIGKDITIKEVYSEKTPIRYYDRYAVPV